MSSRVGFFKNVNQASVDADQASAILSLQGSITTINTTLASKADSSALSAYALAEDIPDVSGFALSADVTSALASKADSSALSAYALAEDIPDVSGFALSADVTTALNNKANSSDLADVVTDVSALQTDVSALQTKDSAINEFVLALKEVLYISNADNSGEFSYTAFE